MRMCECMLVPRGVCVCVCVDLVYVSGPVVKA